MRFHITFLLALILFACRPAPGKKEVKDPHKLPAKVSLVVLGSVQDAGAPHIGCQRDCCKRLFDQPDPTLQVVSLGIVDQKHQQKYLFEATPDMPRQIRHLHSWLPKENEELPDGIFLTHAHIGHYTGLMYLGKEAINASSVPVYAMPRMKKYLETSGPWSQLVSLKNIALQPIDSGATIQLNPSLQVTPFCVPHRDEYSETVGYHIRGPEKAALFIPDIDKWEKWDRSIEDMIAKVAYAFLDATFFDVEEIG